MPIAGLVHEARGTRERSSRVRVPRVRRIWRIARWPILVIAIALVAGRLALPGYLESYVNRVIDQSPDYDGRVGQIDVHLWRGAYTIYDVDIVKTSHAVPTPFFEGRQVDLAIDWSALYHGRLRGKIVMQSPRLNFVHGPSPEETQTGANQPWLAIIDDLFPFRIDKAEVHDGEVHFSAFHTRPPIDLELAEVEGELRNLTNIEDEVDPLVATVRATGVAMESGRFEFEMSLDPNSTRPTFNMATRILGLDVRKLNSLAMAYGGFDFEAGTFDLVVEATTKDGLIQGYSKPMFRNVQVIGWADVRDGHPVRALWESVVGVGAEVFKNRIRDQVATRITYEGNFDNPRTSILEIVGNVLRNAFIQAYLPRFERSQPEEAAPMLDDSET